MSLQDFKEECSRKVGVLYTDSNSKVIVEIDEYKHISSNFSGIIICHGQFKKLMFNYVGGKYVMYSK